VIPAVSPHVSRTPSPLQITARYVRKKDPEAVVVFIGPCVAKRREAVDDTEVDYYLTFSELFALFEAYEIDLSMPFGGIKSASGASSLGRGFALDGGVIAAVLANLPGNNGIKTVSINGLNKKSLARLESFAKDGCPAGLVEVMNCEGGCINGPAVAVPASQGRAFIEKQLKVDFCQDRRC
jgi:iron only hydrogenase large subunit-like protein